MAWTCCITLLTTQHTQTFATFDSHTKWTRMRVDEHQTLEFDSFIMENEETQREEQLQQQKKKEKLYESFFSLLCFRFPVPYVYTENVKSSHGPYLTLMLGSMSPKTYKIKTEREEEEQKQQSTHKFYTDKNISPFTVIKCAHLWTLATTLYMGKGCSSHISPVFW